MNNIFRTSNPEYRKTDSKKADKLNFKTIKKNTVKSLNDVEYFLDHFNDLYKYVKLYKILK